ALAAGRDGAQQLRVAHVPGPLFAFAPVVVDGLVAGDRRQPGREGPVRFPEAVEVLVHLDEDLLRQVLRLVNPSREPVRHPENPPCVPLDQLAPGSLVSLPAASEEVAVALAQEVRSLPAALRPQAKTARLPPRFS